MSLIFSSACASALIVVSSPHYKLYKSSSCFRISKNANAKSSSLTAINKSFRIFCRYRNYNVIGKDDEDCNFNEAIALLNSREYYKCHDVLEALWLRAEHPTTSTLLHGILQCAVGFHHLFNQNHKGAMMELGEGLCKLRTLNMEKGPFHQFEQEISDALNFIYQTQLELAACTNDLCLAIDQTERSYQLLGDYADGQHLYTVENDLDHSFNSIAYIVLYQQSPYDSAKPPKVRLPILNATEEHLRAFELM